MSGHIKAWEDENRKSIWKGHYSLGLLDPLLKKGRLLDAGCGSGKYSLPLKMRGFDVVGIDVSSFALRFMREGSMAHGLHIDVMAANVFQPPFKDCSFDIIWCYGVLQHLLSNERESAVRKFYSMLKKRGVLYIEVFGKDDMRYGGTEVEHNTFSRANGIVYHYFEKAEIEELLCGFSCNISESHKNKRFKGKLYSRHMISAAARKM